MSAVFTHLDYQTVTIMAARGREVIFDLYGNSANTEREKKFWNRNKVEMKFTLQRQWIKAVKRARYRPNYGMGNMKIGLEEKQKVTDTC